MRQELFYRLCCPRQISLIIILCTQFFLCHAQEKIEKRESDGTIWYKIKKEGKTGALDREENIIVPVEYFSVSYNVKNGEFVVVDNSHGFNYKGIFKKDGTLIIPTTREYTHIQKNKGENLIWYSVTMLDCNSQGICDENGHELLSPNRGYTSATLIKERGVTYIKVIMNDKEGICDISGKEIIPPQYASIIYTSNHFEYKESNGKWVDSGISLNDMAFSSPNNQNSPVNGQTDNDLAGATKTFYKGFNDKSSWYKVSKNGKFGAMNYKGELVVPIEFTEISFDDLTCLFTVRSGQSCGLYNDEGEQLISTRMGYSDIEWTISDCLYSWFKVKNGNYVGAWDEVSKRELISPDKHYTYINLEEENGIKFFCVWKDDKMGICTWNGKEIVAPRYKSMGLTKGGTFYYEGSNGNYYDLHIRPDGSRDNYVAQNSSSQSSPSASTQVTRSGRNNLLRALGLGLLTAVSNMNTNTGYSGGYSVPQRTPMPTYNGNGSAYVAQIQARTNQQMANLNNQVQQMTQNATAQVQNYNNRSLNAFTELGNWCTLFTRQYGREPYESEKDQWMQQHYPDVYPYYIQGKYGGQNNNVSGNSESAAKENNSSSQGESIREKNKQYWEDRKIPKDCDRCRGTGICQTCNGNGYYTKIGIGSGTYPCPNCASHPYTHSKNGDGKCAKCRGNGKTIL